MDRNVNALAVLDGQLYAGGGFSKAGRISANRVARWDGAKWSALGSELGMVFGGVNALAVWNGNLYAGGRSLIARWDGAEWSRLSSGLDARGDEGYVRSLKVFDGALYAGGRFSQVGEINANSIARWDGTEWSALDSGLLDSSVFKNVAWVYALEVFDGGLYAGGVFSEAGGISANSIARWDGSEWSTLGTGVSGTVYSLEVFDGDMFVGGDFTKAGEISANSIARWNGTEWSALGQGMDSYVYALAVTGNDLFVGGRFASVGGKPSDYLAKLVTTDIPQTISVPAVGTKNLSDMPFNLSATASSGLAVTFKVISGPASLEGNSITLTGSGVVKIEASQSGDERYAAATPVIRSFRVNTGGPTELSVTSDWFYDDVTVGTVIGNLQAQDPDEGDIMTYTLVEGSGDADNAKFTIVGDELRSADNFGYDLQRTLSIRVRATDLGGLSLERIIRLSLVDAAPTARFEPIGVFPTAPSYVNVAFQLTDLSGQGINIPRDLFDQSIDIFQVREEGTAISPTESFLQVGKIDEIPAVIRTVILLDNSASVGINLLKVREAASALVDQILPQQEMAIYSFSNELTELQSFTGDKAALKAAIDGMSLGAATTNLNGSMLEALDKWPESFDETGIETGFLVVFTDGSDTSGTATTQEVLNKRNAEEKSIFTIGLGNEVEPQALSMMGNAGSWPIEEFDELETAFAEVQQSIEDTANSFYWVNYASPRRGDVMRSLTVSLKGNTYTGQGSVLSAQFSSAGFSDVERGVTINRSVDHTEGVFSLEIEPDASEDARAFTILPLIEEEIEYSWTLDDPSLATLVSLEDDDSRIRIVPDGREGTTNLTVVDTANTSWAEELGLSPTTYTRTIELVIGSGVPSEPDFATWVADSGLTGADAEPDAIPHDDGVSNLLKFAFNMDASRADRSQLVAGGGGTSGLPAVELDPDDPEPVLTIEFLRRRDGSLIYTPQFTSDLSDWPAASPSLTVEPVDDQWERVTVRDPDGPSDPDKRFGRVEVSLPGTD